MKRYNELLHRQLAFVPFFSILPAVAGVIAALAFRGGGVRGTSTAGLGILVWRADPSFVTKQVLSVLGASIGIAAMFALGSLLAWRADARYRLLRAIRLVALIWGVAILLYPGMGSWMPVVRRLPWSLSLLVLACLLCAAYTWRGARAGKREWAFVIVAVGLFFWTPPRWSRNLRDVSGRAFTSRDIIILGFDSMSFDDASDVLREFTPSVGRKTLYSQARTTFPATSAAWRSIFSGRYPPPEATVIPGIRWGKESDSAGWLPSELRALGYMPTIAQDSPGSNWFSKSEDLNISGLQGWKESFRWALWTMGFPLFSAGASWWVSLLGGPGDSASRHAHCADCFIRNSLNDMARAAGNGPVFWSIHTCLAHEPYRLALSEAVRIPGWWKLPPTFFLARGASSLDTRAYAVRNTTLRKSVGDVLTFLDQNGVLGYASVFVLGDHGPRGENVPKAKTESVMLALFSSGGQGVSNVTTPVSLVDIAPTIREIVDLPGRATDGRVLPLADVNGDSGRVVRTAIARPGGLQSLLGIGEQAMTSDELGRIAELQKDGGFLYSQAVVARIRRMLDK